jgi:hypothetical protein
MAKSITKGIDLDFAFFEYLHQFYRENKGTIRRNYREATKVFLDYNNSEKNTTAFLRAPQFEALEIYVFIKEYLKNPKVCDIFETWYHKNDKFEKRSEAGIQSGEQISLFGVLDDKSYKNVFSKMKKMAQFYPNYIYALTMGTGKTILMATCIFYEFILAWKFPDDLLYCHNALVFAPDKTVLQSLREIETFNMRKVVPPEYYNFLNSHLRFHYLDDAGTTLNTLDRSQFNIIVSNTQKIILKKKHKEKPAQEKLFSEDKSKTVKISSVYKEVEDLYDFDGPENEIELSTNQRFSKLCRLEQLGIYVDEAHHAFGNQLAKDMGTKKAATSLRVTIDFLAAELKKAGTRVVACFNYTGTPYVGCEILPEVVYAYGLRKAIDNKYLKTVVLHGYTNPKETEFVRLAIEHFWKSYSEERREGMLPKIAFFASTIKELTDELRPKVEKILSELDISTDKILVNVGDDKITSNDDIREFNRLDSVHSDKQFILLVNKGREGWNCRSLFAVSMYRAPKSKIFVLQATMRCLREIGEKQDQANVYLSDENYKILEDELQQNFRISADEFQKGGTKRKQYKVRPVDPLVTIKMKKVRKFYELSPKKPAKNISLNTDKWNTERYRLLHTQREGMDSNDARIKNEKTEDFSEFKEKREFSVFTLVAEVARYLNLSPIEIEEILRSTQDGVDEILKSVNNFNELLYDELIPRLFRQLYDLQEKKEETEQDIELVKIPDKGYFAISADPDLVIEIEHKNFKKYRDKSFHLDTYCFDSSPEMICFDKAIRDAKVNKVYFTGMLTHGQSDFFIPYIDPETHAVRTYYPDFLIREKDGSYTIVEVKGEHQIEDPVVEAKKESAEQLASDNKMRYLIVPSKNAGSIIGYLQKTISETP